MRNQILALAVLTAFAAPAAAQTIYDDGYQDPTIVQEGTYDGAADVGIDDTRTGSITVDPTNGNDGACQRGPGIDSTSNPQCDVFGGNSD